MRRFKFSLETVLRVRRSKEEMLQREFSALLEKQARCMGEIARLERGLAEMVQAQSGTRGGTLDAGMIEIYEMSRLAQLEKILKQRFRLKGIREELEAKRLELVAASRDRKVLETLEENQYEDYLKKLNREEQAFLDELAAHNSAHQADILI
jgi:flagellar FliJ protein